MIYSAWSRLMIVERSRIAPGGGMGRRLALRSGHAGPPMRRAGRDHLTESPTAARRCWCVQAVASVHARLIFAADDLKWSPRMH
jgi:hypothetical protein